LLSSGALALLGAGEVLHGRRLSVDFELDAP
jgi:hypothetical protein